jgi:hypothetical protein
MVKPTNYASSIRNLLIFSAIDIPHLSQSKSIISSILIKSPRFDGGREVVRFEGEERLVGERLPKKAQRIINRIPYNPNLSYLH